MNKCLLPRVTFAFIFIKACGLLFLVCPFRFPAFAISLGCVNGGFPGGLDGKASACTVGDRVQTLGGEDPLEKEMATHSSTVAWKIPWTVAYQGHKELDKTERLHFHCG